ncbi:DNA translocase FtsK [Microvirga tunisiensis]|uniref:DNA translocase FtsK n=1 Tax=Pannonibacter tanglangensis TaxID=2750084 RepID=A0A7X5F683_9HYPH|nr:DNA translocase FtsK [Pannonibacter sp. XCT-53]NBN80269.1 DNA translocase FtsK [Pannonibacter sp. XCT-53]
MRRATAMRGSGRGAAHILDTESPLKRFLRRNLVGLAGLCVIGLAAALAAALATWSVTDPSLNHATDGPVRNALGTPGAIIADMLMQSIGLATSVFLVPVVLWGWRLIAGKPLRIAGRRILFWFSGTLLASGAVAALPVPESWPLPTGLGGFLGDAVHYLPGRLTEAMAPGTAMIIGAIGLGLPAVLLLIAAGGWFGRARAEDDDLPLPKQAKGRRGQPVQQQMFDDEDEDDADDTSRFSALLGAFAHWRLQATSSLQRVTGVGQRSRAPREPDEDDYDVEMEDPDLEPAPRRRGFGALGRGLVSRLMPGEDDDGLDELYPAQGGGRREPARQGGRDVARETGRDPEREASRSLARHPATGPRIGGGRHDEVYEDDDDTGLDPDHDAAAYERDLDDDSYGYDEPPFDLDDEDEADARLARGRDGRLAGDGMAAERAPLDRAPLPRPVGIAGPAAAPSRGPAARAGGGQPAQPVVPQGGARVVPQAARPQPGKRLQQEAQSSLLGAPDVYELPPLRLLAEPRPAGKTPGLSPDALEQNARILEGVLEDFGVRGEIIEVRPGPVVTLYELEPAPGIKSSRVIGLADDIARSMSAISARVAVIPGKNAIGIELPNQKRETVYLRELLAAQDFEKSKHKLAMALGKTINGESVIADLARMPHLLVAGTTGSGKSVSINTMILSLLYRLTPDQCKMIMIDPKMLELSIYDGIPHLLTPVVTDPKKAVVALKWTVREMEERYKKMSKMGVRNIDGYNTRVKQALEKGESFSRTVQTGFDRDTGQPIYEEEDLPLEPMPYIVVIVDEMADLMMVAGKDIEGAIQRLAQMARAAGIHIIMATQRPSVDVITGTIKANFPTRISFQVTSKIDSRTILGEQGAEQLLGMGDMLYMAGGGRIQRVHGPFVADEEVEQIVAHLKLQGSPQYLEAVTEEEDMSENPYDAVSGGDEGNDLYDKAVAVVLRDKKVSTSYVQRRLGIGYNRAASLIERMEKEGLISPANHAGKREILVKNGVDEDY